MIAAAVLAVAVIGSVGCSPGQRTTLVAAPEPTPVPPLQLDLAPAPGDVAPLAPAPPDLALESSVDDALLSWAIDRSIPYTDACARTTPLAGQLCDSPTARDTVRLLGPSSDEIWYVVTVEYVKSGDIGSGFRVQEVTIAGR